jgi:hypothetical protein
MGRIYEVHRYDWPCAMMYIQSFINIGLGTAKLRGEFQQTHAQNGDCVSIHLFLQNKDSRLKKYLPFIRFQSNHRNETCSAGYKTVCVCVYVYVCLICMLLLVR